MLLSLHIECPHEPAQTQLQRAAPHPGALMPAAPARSLAVALALTLSAATTRAQTVRDDTWMPNGAVNAIALSSNTAYIGGDFNRVQPPTGAFVAVDPTTAQPIGPFPL